MVTRNPGSTLEQNVRAALSEIDHLILVDNGSDPEDRIRVRALAELCNFEVVRNDENLGIAGGLNAGIRHALASGDYAWIATFDDDSRVSPGFRQAMLEAYGSCPYRDQVGLIGPCHVLFPEDPAARALRGPVTPSFVEKPVMLQSGSLLSVEGLRRVGLLDESFFIDYVDFEFCLRLRKHGLRILEATNATLVHRVGAPTFHTVFRMSCVVLNHSPLRRYYAARNRLRTYRRYMLSDPGWFCHDAWSWFKQVVKLVLFEKDRRRKLAFMAEGAWDALCGRNGVYHKGRLPSS